MLLPKAVSDGDDVDTYRRCVLIEEVCHQVKELWKEGGTQNIRDDEKQFGWIQIGHSHRRNKSLDFWLHTGTCTHQGSK